LGAIARKATRAIEHGERAVGVLVHLDAGLDVVGPHRAFRELEAAPLIGHGVIAGDDALLFNAQDVSEACRLANGHEGALLGDLRQPGELRVVQRQVNFADIAVGFLDMGLSVLLCKRPL
jgi:hypothetical protein